MVRPTTRNQWATTVFNNEQWPVRYDTTLVDSLYMRTRNIEDLSSSAVFEAVIEQVWADMVRILGRSFSLHEVKVRIDSIRRRFYQFMLFTTLPGVHFNRMTNHLRFGPEYTSAVTGESLIRRYFRHYGFPYYEICNDVFEFKNAAAIDFQGVPGYNPNDPIEIEDSVSADNAIVPIGGNEEEEQSANNNMAVHDGGNEENAMVVYEGNREDNNGDQIDPMDEFRYGWDFNDDYSSSGGHSSDSQNTWSR